MRKTSRTCVSTVLVLVLAAVLGCSSDNDHFCAKYSYFYDQLSQPGILPYADIKRQLEADIKKSGRDRDKLMLLVLEDKQQGLMRGSETAAEYCVRRKRWESVQLR